MVQLRSLNLKDTQRIAAGIAKKIKPGERLALDGPLGAGKTTFVRALARAVGVEYPEDVVSPTYTLVNEYPLKMGGALIHIDFYRLEGGAKAFALGIEEEIWRPDAIVVMEWAKLFADHLPEDTHWLSISIEDDGRVFEGEILDGL